MPLPVFCERRKNMRKKKQEKKRNWSWGQRTIKKAGQGRKLEFHSESRLSRLSTSRYVGS